MTFLLATNDLRLFQLISKLQRGEGGHSGNKPYFLEWLNDFATDCRLGVTELPKVEQTSYVVLQNDK